MLEARSTLGSHYVLTLTATDCQTGDRSLSQAKPPSRNILRNSAPCPPDTHRAGDRCRRFTVRRPESSRRRAVAGGAQRCLVVRGSAPGPGSWNGWGLNHAIELTGNSRRLYHLSTVYGALQWRRSEKRAAGQWLARRRERRASHRVPLSRRVPGNQDAAAGPPLWSCLPPDFGRRTPWRLLTTAAAASIGDRRSDEALRAPGHPFAVEPRLCLSRARPDADARGPLDA